MNFVESVKTALKKYATFSGRASRSEFWWFSLFSLVATIAGMFLMMVIAAGVLSLVPMKQPQTGGMHFPLGALFFILILLALFLPSLAVLVRRLHDLNYSSWWVLALFLIELVMNVVSRNEETNGGAVGLFGLINICINIGVIIFLAQRGSIGSNRFGADPLASDRSDVI